MLPIQMSYINTNSFVLDTSRKALNTKSAILTPKKTVINRALKTGIPNNFIGYTDEKNRVKPSQETGKPDSEGTPRCVKWQYKRCSEIS